jgi:hypothetical protein
VLKRCVKKDLKKKEKEKKQQTYLTFPASPTHPFSAAHLFFLFPPPAHLSLPRPILAGPAHPPSLPHTVTDRWGPPVGTSFYLQPAAPFLPRAGRRPSLRIRPPRVPLPPLLSHKWRRHHPLHRLNPSPPRNGRRTEPPPPPPLMEHRPSSATASVRRSPFPLRPIKGQNHLFSTPHRSPELPLSSTPPPQEDRTGAPPLVVDLLHRRFSFLFEQLGETPFFSSLFWCLFPVV